MIDYNYHKLLEEILNNGYEYEDPNRKSVIRKQINSYNIKHEFKHGFPLLTTKFVSFKSVVGEFLTFIKGDNTLGGLEKNGVKFWRKDALRWLKQDPKYSEAYKKNIDTRGAEELVRLHGEDIDLGKIYPYQMRNWDGKIDQLQELVNTLLNNPMATKKTVTMWNPSDKHEMALSPCHHIFEALVEPLETGYGLTIKFSMGSVDVFLGSPFNIAYYSLMCYFLAEMTGMKPLGIEAVLSNVHIYDNHMEAVKEQLNNDVNKYILPTFKFSDTSKHLFRRIKNLGVLDYITTKDFIIENYESYPRIKAEMLTYNK